MSLKPPLSALLASLGTAMLATAAFAGAADSTPSRSARPHSNHALRGGTLRLLSHDSDFASVDPGLTDDSLSWSMLYTTQMLLMNLPEKNGAAGTVLYPEAATTFPTTSRDGKTYTFHIRPGLRFSDGSPVTAACFRRAWERSLSPKMGAPVGVNDRLQDVVVGANAFNKGKAQKISGITARGLTLTFHLTKPNPAFNWVLSQVWFGAVKPNMPYTTTGLNTYPSAGPYYIQSRDAGRSLVEVRNPYYKGPRPANPDKIVSSMNTDQDQGLLEVEAGQADLDVGSPPPSSNAQLARQYGINRSRFFVGPTSCVIYEALNTSRPPFSNLNYRKAVNWAIDRPSIVRLRGKYASKPTDRILVPGVPGFKPYNLYSIRGANLDQAREYAPHGIPGTIVVMHSTSPASVRRAQVIEHDLQQIGAHTRDKPVPVSRYYGVLGTRGVDMDIAHAGWCALGFDPYNYINLNFDGRSIRARNNVNFAYLNSPTLDRQMDAAASLTGSARAQAYQRLDREIMADYAPWVPEEILNGVFFVSARVKNYAYSKYFGEPFYNALSVG
jgi:peptide/nickel transport system substrate-binding protein